MTSIGFYVFQSLVASDFTVSPVDDDGTLFCRSTNRPQSYYSTQKFLDAITYSCLSLSCERSLTSCKVHDINI